MKDKNIRIIKKKDLFVETESSKHSKEQVADGAKRVMSNVSAWVSDFQQRKSKETAKAFETIFSNGPRKAES